MDLGLFKNYINNVGMVYFVDMGGSFLGLTDWSSGHQTGPLGILLWTGFKTVRVIFHNSYFRELVLHYRALPITGTFNKGICLAGCSEICPAVR